jgi:DNA-binding beta-propeller fold protein YncE
MNRTDKPEVTPKEKRVFRSLRHKLLQHSNRSYMRIVFVLLVLPLGTLLAATALGGYHLLKEIPVPGDGSKDYLTVDEGGRRLYVSHGTQVDVIDLDSEQVVGKVSNLKGVHGIAVAPKLGRGFITNGLLNTVTVFDLKTLEHLDEVKASITPDGIVYDSATERVFALNKHGDSVTAIEAADGKVAGTIDLNADPESPVTDGKGNVWVNLEHWSTLVRIDARNLTVTGRWSTAPRCDHPAPMAIDRKGNRLFIGCGNEVLDVANPDTGETIATVPIGPDVDAVAFDPSTGLIFSANDGTVTVIHQDSLDKYSVVETFKTQPQAATLALDPKTHRIYVSTSDLGPAPAPTPVNQHPDRPMVPGTFKVLVFGK